MLITKEYLTLFNTITDAIERLDRLRGDLAAAQALAEELCIGSDEAPAPRPSAT